MNENKVKRRFGDRYEGRRIRGYNPMDRVAWYIMPRRNGATNLLAYSVDVASMEDYIRQKRAEGLDSFGITHVLLAAYVRTVSQRPALNRSSPARSSTPATRYGSIWTLRRRCAPAPRIPS